MVGDGADVSQVTWFRGWAGTLAFMAAGLLALTSLASVASAAGPYQLEVKVSPPQAGSVVSIDPPGTDCDDSCQETFNENDVVTLTAKPGPDMILEGWLGDCSGTDLVCTVTMDADRQVRANFRSVYRLDVVLNGSGTGTVTSPGPGGIDCEPDCSVDFPEGTVLTLTAAAATGVFTHWSGDCSGTGPVCTVTVNGPVSVGAFFQLEWPVTVVRSGAGSGRVTSSPAGIDCGPTCSFTYTETTALSLTATPDPGSVFKRWTGSCSGTDPSCIMLISGPMFPAAEFAPARNLTVNLAGNGQGRVTGSPAGIDCGTACSVDLEVGERVTLAATPEPGFLFAGWGGGACEGTAPTCEVELDEDVTVTATFVRPGHGLTVTRSGNGGGRVTSSPAGIECGADCEGEYADGAAVTLTATPDAGSIFNGWSGACRGSGTTCQLTMDRSLTATATFLRLLPPVKAADGGTATYDPATGRLAIRLKCGQRFRPRCLTMRAVAVTGSKGKAMSSPVKIAQKAGKWKLVTLKIKPKFRNRVALLATIDRKTLMIRVDVTHRKRRGKKVRKLTRRVFPKYRVRIKR